MANIIRMAEIESRIMAGSYPNRSQLAKLLEVSTKTIARDIEIMRDQGAPIEYDAFENGYYISDESYKFSQLEIKAKEVFSLFLAERALEQYQGTPMYKTLSSIFDRLKSYVPGQDSIDTQWLSEKVIFHALPNVKVNPDHWATIMAAIEAENYISFMYQSPRSLKKHNIAPLYIINYQGQWIMLGFSEADNDYRNYALSRIKSITVKKNSQIPYRYRNDIKEKIDNQFGIYFSQRPMEFKIRFDSSVALIIEERKWSKDQQITRNKNGSITLTFSTHCIQDVKRWILQWGDKAKLLKPKSVLDELKTELKATLNQYK